MDGGLFGAGKTLAENLEGLPGLAEHQQVVKTVESPIKPTAHLQVMYGNLAPEGCVGKITGKEGLSFEGVARCFDREEDMLDTLAKDPDSFKVTGVAGLPTPHAGISWSGGLQPGGSTS